MSEAQITTDTEFTSGVSEFSTSWIAIIAGIMALLSPLSIVSGRLVFIPTAALAFGLVAYFLLAKNPFKRGKPMAVAGTLVGALFSSWSGTETFAFNSSVFENAGKYSIEWIKIVEDGNRELAYELTLNEGARQLKSLDLKVFYETNMERRASLETFFAKPAVQALMKRKNKGTWKFVRSLGISRKPSMGDMVRVLVEDDSSSSPFRLVVTIFRNTNETVDHHLACWHVQDVAFEN